MKLKVSNMLSMALILSSISINTFAYDNDVRADIRAVKSSMVMIDNVGTLLKEDILEDVDLNRTGSITITLPETEDNGDKSNVKFGLSKVADIVDGEYKVLEQYKNVGTDLNNIKTATDLEIAANLFSKVVSTDNTLTTDGNGKCSIDNLEIGVYLVFATDIANYENITPFLVSIPSWNENDKAMSYDIKVIPKHTRIIEKEKPKVPSTGYDNKSFLYLGLGTCLLVSSSILFVGSSKKDRE